MTTTPTTQMHSVTVSHAGGSLHITDHPGEAPAVVAMHGFPDDHHIYDRLIPRLDGRRVVTFDWLGGRSDRCRAASFHPADRQRDLTAVLDQLDVHYVVLVAGGAGPGRTRSRC